jgi:hypothetical protein
VCSALVAVAEAIHGQRLLRAFEDCQRKEIQTAFHLAVKAAQERFSRKRLRAATGRCARADGDRRTDRRAGRQAGSQAGGRAQIQTHT